VNDANGITTALTTNFRTIPSIVHWVNRVFSAAFPQVDSPSSPRYIPLDVPDGWTDRDAELSGIFQATIPEPDSNSNERAVAYDAAQIAQFIADILERGPMVMKRVPGSTAAPAPITPTDIMIITYRTANLSCYAAALDQFNIPHQVTGGTTVNDLVELPLLELLLRALLRPHDSVALVGLLRSELFGVSDIELYRFKTGGGRFCFLRSIPKKLNEQLRARFSPVMARLKSYHQLLLQRPSIGSLEQISVDIGLFASAALAGNAHAGTFSKIFEILRHRSKPIGDLHELSAQLKALAAGEEAYDGIDALAISRSAVRIMNLHKAKGLEAPVVFLADPTGIGSQPIDVHIDRIAGSSKGYLAIRSEQFGHHHPIVAAPSSWEAVQAKEREQLMAEAIRLRYVGATRAMSMLVISQRATQNHRNPWQPFEPYLKDRPVLLIRSDRSSSPPTAPTNRPHATRLAFDPAQAFSHLANRHQAIQQPTEMTSAAKAWAMRDETHFKQTALTRLPGIDVGDDALSWGQAIHRLVEIAITSSPGELAQQAKFVLAEFGIAPSETDRAVRLVSTICATEIWQRAVKSTLVLTEVPFQVMWPPESLPFAQTLLRGAIDLLFREPRGWVVVDYKTDQVDASQTIQRLVETYRPQVELYRDVWQYATGELVAESYLLFTSTKELVRI